MRTSFQVLKFVAVMMRPRLIIDPLRSPDFLKLIVLEPRQRLEHKKIKIKKLRLIHI
jgi:hypothetical protein